MTVQLRWFGLIVYRFDTAPPRVWQITLRIGRRRDLRIEYR